MTYYITLELHTRPLEDVGGAAMSSIFDFFCLSTYFSNILVSVGNMRNFEALKTADMTIRTSNNKTCA